MSFRRKKAEGSRSIIFVLAFILAGIVVATALIADRIDSRFKESIVEQWSVQLSSISKISSLNIESFFSKFGDNLLTIADNPMVQDKTFAAHHNPDDTSYCCIKSLYEIHKNDIDAIVLQNKEGGLILGYPDNFFKNPDHLKRLSSKLHVDTFEKEKIYVSDVFTNKDVQQDFVISVPIFKHSNYIGLISWIISVDKLTKKYLDPVILGQNAYLWMIDNSDRILAHHDSNYLGLNSWYIMKDFEITQKVAGYSMQQSRLYLKETKEFFEEMLIHHSGIGRYIDFAHSEYCLATYQKIPIHNNFWTIITNVPYSLILEPVKRNTIKVYVLSGVVICIFTLIVLLLFRLQRSRQLLAKETEYHMELAKKAEQIKEERQKKLTAQIDGQEIERKRVSREIHDGLGQYLLSLKVRLEEMYKSVPDKLSDHILELRSIFQKTLEETKRISNNLLPISLEELGLSSSIKNLCDDFSANTRIQVDFVTHGVSELMSIKQKTYLYRISQEALNNIQKHANATEVNVQLLGNEEQLTLIIQDNGKGFDYKEGYNTKGNGLNNMRDRAEILNGHCQVESMKGQGTIITIKIPIQKIHAKDTHYTS
ncbi:MAG: hypothetical protein ISR55_09555 [Bacteroidetes bacterium]|nr:hypothetical protein [Bacteroidota bacterium]MBL6964060.1 hypothetical protein [Bacteroidota bacterium]